MIILKYTKQYVGDLKKTVYLYRSKLNSVFKLQRTDCYLKIIIIVYHNCRYFPDWSLIWYWHIFYRMYCKASYTMYSCTVIFFLMFTINEASSKESLNKVLLKSHTNLTRHMFVLSVKWALFIWNAIRPIVILSFRIYKQHLLKITYCKITFSTSLWMLCSRWYLQVFFIITQSVFTLYVLIWKYWLHFILVNSLFKSSKLSEIHTLQILKPLNQ